MHIQWLGASAFKLQIKALSEDVTLVIDPHKQEKGEFPRSLAPHIAINTQAHKEMITLSGEPFVLTTPGEIETKGVLIQAIPSKNPKSNSLRIDAEKLSIAHLGAGNEELNEAEMEALNGIDILCLPVGGGEGLAPDKASKIISAIEPRVVIPYGMQSDNEPDNKPAESFIKELGIAPEKPGNKVIIKKKDLPQEEMQLFVLEKE